MSFSVYTQYHLPASFQMGLDQALFENLELERKSAFLRFYTMEGSSATVGYFMRRQERENNRFLEEVSGPVVKRFTGGGVVLHGKDLVFSLGANRTLFPFLRSTQESYIWIHTVIQKALEKFHIKTDLGPAPDPSSRSLPVENQHVCFQNPVRGDLLLGSLKVAGGAQKRSREYFLHQGSILLDWGKNDVGKISSFAETLLKTFEEAWQIKFLREELTPQVLKRAKELSETRYRPLSKEFIYES